MLRGVSKSECCGFLFSCRSWPKISWWKTWQNSLTKASCQIIFFKIFLPKKAYTYVNPELKKDNWIEVMNCSELAVSKSKFNVLLKLWPKLEAWDFNINAVNMHAFDIFDSKNVYIYDSRKCMTGLAPRRTCHCISPYTGEM